jgi:hypothetical protein
MSKTVANVERRVERMTLSSAIAMSLGPISLSSVAFQIPGSKFILVSNMHLIWLGETK